MLYKSHTIEYLNGIQDYIFKNIKNEVWKSVRDSVSLYPRGFVEESVEFEVDKTEESVWNSVHNRIIIKWK